MPKISCLMATYNRPSFAGGMALLEEAVECFSRQTLPPSMRELIVLNDTPGQTLSCDAPGVTVYNVDRRFPSLSAKYNALASLASGDFLAAWDDDDLSLPRRLETSLSRIGDEDYWRPDRHIFQNGRDPCGYDSKACGHNMALFRRDLWTAAGGFRGQADWDQRFQAAVNGREMAMDPINSRRRPAVAGRPVADVNVFYVYRWGVSPAHVSDMPAGDEGWRGPRRGAGPAGVIHRHAGVAHELPGAGRRLGRGRRQDGGVRMSSLCLGMACYRDYDGVWACLQGLRADPASEGCQFVVVDNFGDDDVRHLCQAWGAAQYVLKKDVVGTAAPREEIFRQARTDFVMVVDCHVGLVPGALARLREFLDVYPDCPDLLQGPMLYDDLRTYASHFDDEWRAGMWGTWAADGRAADPDGRPFEIPMQGLGLFCARRETWPGFSPLFRGFGGEEGYVHMKYKRCGARTLCLPFLRWYHRTKKTGAAASYPNLWEDRVWNYCVGHAELGLPPDRALDHFLSLNVDGLGRQGLTRVNANALAALAAAKSG